MTIEQAYAEGFCKAAEAAGVDPVALYKRAGWLGTLAAAPFRIGGRYLGKMFGGKVGKMDRQLGVLRRLSERTANNMASAGVTGDRAGVIRSSGMLDRIAHRRELLEARRAAEAGSVRRTRVGTALVGATALGAAGGKAYSEATATPQILGARQNRFFDDDD